MKKLLGISLVAIMSVSAANAEIASKAYVDQQDGDLTTLTTSVKTSLVGAINELNTKAGDTSVADQIAEALEAYTETGEDENYAPANVLDSLNYTSTGDGVVTAVSQTNGAVSATKAKITNTEIADNAAIAQSKIDGLTTALDAKANTADLGTAAFTASTAYATAAQGTTADNTAAAVNNATTGLAATKAIADAADTLSKANKAELDALGDTYATDQELSTALSEYTKTGADTAYATAAQGLKADSAVQSVTKSGTGNILTDITTTGDAVTVTVSGTAIPQPSGNCADCVLHYNGTAYSWEEIAR